MSKSLSKRKRLVFSAVTVVLILIVVEGISRVFFLVKPGPGEFVSDLYDLYSVPDTVCGHAMQPNVELVLRGHPDYTFTVKTSTIPGLPELGFREESISERTDIVFIGDSFIWGYGVEQDDVISAVCARECDFRTVNLAVSGFNGPLNYLGNLLRVSKLIDYDCVIMGFSSQNDLYDASVYKQWRASGSSQSLVHFVSNRVPFLKRVDLQMKQRVKLYALVREVAKRLFPSHVYGAVGYTPLSTPAGNIWVRQAVTRLRRQGDYLRASPRQKATWEESIRAVSEAADFVTKRGKRFVLLMIPKKEEVYLFPEEGSAGLGDCATNVLAKLFAEQGIEVLNPLPILRSKVQGENLLYFPHDGHWTAAAHHIVGEALCAHLRRPIE